MAAKHSQIPIVNRHSATDTEQIKANKEAFRQHQRALPFGEKMRIAFELAGRDETIRRAVLLTKSFRNEEK